MTDVVLLYERSCPNVREARANLLRAFAEANVSPYWREVDVDAVDTPAEWRAFGSPTILIDGIDVGEGSRAEGASCRLYVEGPPQGNEEGSGTQAMGATIGRAPPVERIASMLRNNARTPVRSRSGGRASFAAAPGVLIALLPKILCPACWPAYAAVLSAVGLGFLMQSRYLLPLTMVFVALATMAIAYRGPMRRGYAPAFVAGAAGASLVVLKFALDSTSGSYIAASVFAIAALWNAWPIRRAISCPACVGDPSTTKLAL